MTEVKTVHYCDEETCEKEATRYLFQSDTENIAEAEEIAAEGFFVCDDHIEAAANALAAESERKVYEADVNVFAE